MRGSFLEYAYSVIYSRALPDARDGLKPVQRRILYQMAEMGLRPDRGHVKSARVVGEVMGRLHPHGDSAIYDALVRMAQPFSLRLPLIDGHGNFGSLDDGPAAMRYTECRLAPAAETVTTSLNEDVVDYVANYDGRELEPVVLPASVPLLLVNGAAGIAVGMATNMPPHNLGEVCAAAKLLLRKPRSSLDDLMDAACCSSDLRAHSKSLGHVPLIDHNPRRGERIEFSPAEALRYNERSAAERSNARLKDEFGGRNIRVKGHTKVMAHLMFGLLALSADQLMRLQR